MRVSANASPPGEGDFQNNGEIDFPADGLLYLFDGLPLLPTLIGIFALPEMIDLMMRNQPMAQPGSVSNQQVFEGARYGLRQWPMTIRQSISACFWALIPALLMALIIFGVFNHGMYIEWPAPLALPSLGGD